MGIPVTLDVLPYNPLDPYGPFRTSTNDVQIELTKWVDLIRLYAGYAPSEGEFINDEPLMVKPIVRRGYEVLDSLVLEVNEVYDNDVRKYPALEQTAQTLFLQTTESSYFASIDYNFSMHELKVSIYDANSTLVQALTRVEPFPVNLINCMELRGYGLFYLHNTFYFCRLNGYIIDYDLMLDELSSIKNTITLGSTNG